MPRQMQHQFISSPNDADKLLAQLANDKFIAVDTEFFRETTYYPQLALVQVATSDVLAFIDPLAFDARAILRQLFCNSGLIKIFHSCSQDLEVIFHYLGERPVAIHDTQVANALLCDEQQISYASLVENKLAVTLDKSQTRTNWLQRPLTKNQLKYAGEDVIYLYQLYQLMIAQLEQAGRKPWFEEECAGLVADNIDSQAATDTLWRRVKGASKLSREKLAIAQSIAEWREQLAQQKDKTRRRILADETIIRFALDPPENFDSMLRDLGKIKLNNAELQQLFQSITAALQSTPDTWPDNRFTQLDNQQKRLLKDLQQIISDKADELKISPGILAPKKELEKLILHFYNTQETRDESDSDRLKIVHGWRYRCIGQSLMEAIKTRQ